MVYEDMLEEFLIPILEEKGPDDMLFQQDRATSVYHKEVTDFLNRKFPEKWIDRGGPITWPPCSPDLLKDAVYVPPLATTLLELAGRI
jgi:hypothetical protein